MTTSANTAELLCALGQLGELETSRAERHAAPAMHAPNAWATPSVLLLIESGKVAFDPSPYWTVASDLRSVHRLRGSQRSPQRFSSACPGALRRCATQTRESARTSNSR